MIVHQLNPEIIRWGRRILDPLRRYHRYELFGSENIPTDGPAIIAASHSLATYDGLLMCLTIWEETGRLPVALGDNLLFKIPGLRELVAVLGIYPASPANGEHLLRDGHLLSLAPGGMREALRPSSERYRVRWDKRRGFVRLSIRTGAPIILAACPAADDLYTVYESPLTKMGYRSLKVPLPLARGVGPTILPRPVHLVHVLHEPIAPPPFQPERFSEQVEEHHAHLVTQMQRLMQTSL